MPDISNGEYWKIDSVVSDLFGVTGRNLIFLLCNESELSIEKIKENAKRGLKAKSEELHRSIQGFFEDHHRFQLIGMMEMITIFEKRISEITERMDTLTAKHQDLLDRPDEIPGIDKKSAQSIVKHGETFIDLGEDYLSVQTKQRAINNIKKRAKQLGYELVPCAN